MDGRKGQSQYVANEGVVQEGTKKVEIAIIIKAIILQYNADDDDGTLCTYPTGNHTKCGDRGARSVSRDFFFFFNDVVQTKKDWFDWSHGTLQTDCHHRNVSVYKVTQRTTISAFLLLNLTFHYYMQALVNKPCIDSPYYGYLAI